MPWKASDAHSKTHKADTAKKQSQWHDIANGLLAKGVPEGEAIKQANGVIRKESKKK